MKDEGAPGPAPTIYDVARVAGVAPSTVSRAFSRPGRVNAATAARIRAVAEEIGYRSNPVARAHSTTRTRMLAMVISDVTNPFYGPLIRGAQMAGTQEGFVLLLEDTQESPEIEREALERVLPVVEGIVMASPRMSDSALRTIAKQKPLVVLNRAVVDVPSVVTDNPRGMRRAMEHLGTLGHRAVAYVAGPEASWADGMRWQAFREAGGELEMATRRVGPFAPNAGGGLLAAAQLAADPPTAVVVYNDQMAIGVIRGLERSGLRVPRDVSVVSFDDIFVSQLITPPLTTVAAPLRAMGETAMRTLVTMIRGAQPATGKALVLPTKLVERESTAPPRPRR